SWVRRAGRWWWPDACSAGEPSVSSSGRVHRFWPGRRHVLEPEAQRGQDAERDLERRGSAGEEPAHRAAADADRPCEAVHAVQLPGNLAIHERAPAWHEIERVGDATIGHDHAPWSSIDLHS